MRTDQGRVVAIASAAPRHKGPSRRAKSLRSHARRCRGAPLSRARATRSPGGIEAEERANRRTNPPKTSATNTATEVPIMRAHDDELERLRAEVNCALVLEQSRQGWTLDKEESTARALKYRCGAHIVIVNHEGRGLTGPIQTAT